MDKMEYYYFRNLLGQILTGEQEQLNSILDDFILCDDLILVNSFTELSIDEAIKFLYQNYEYLEDSIQ